MQLKGKHTLPCLVLFAAVAFAQTAQQSQQNQKQPPQPSPRVVQSGAGYVGVDPEQPYRPIPLNRVEQRESIFSFYLRVMNPRQIHWGDELNRRLAILSEQSAENPYFRLCAAQLALIIVLLNVCWLWWDKLHQVRWVAAECLADAINAKVQAEARALEAIAGHNRHMEACNRAVDAHHSGMPGDSTIGELQNELAAARAENGQLKAQLEDKADLQAKLDARLQQLERDIQRRPDDGPNAELMARLARAETQLATRPRKNGS